MTFLHRLYQSIAYSGFLPNTEKLHTVSTNPLLSHTRKTYYKEYACTPDFVSQCAACAALHNASASSLDHP